MVAIKEKLKSIVLIGLLFMALFLTQWILYDEQFSKTLQSSEVELDSTKLLTIVRPQSYRVSFGGVSYTRLYDVALQERIWNEVRPVIVKFGLNYKALTIIDKSEYINRFSDASLMMRMPLELDGSSLFSVWTNETIGAELSQISVYEFLLKAGDHRNLYVFDRQNDTYYKLTMGENTHDIGSLVNTLKEVKHVEYRKVSYRFSLENTVSSEYNQLNYELIPFQYDYIVPKLGVKTETYDDLGALSENANAIVKTVFGDRMDFVKRLKDVNGALIMMYGYGEKTLHFESDGTIEYNQKFDPSKSSNLTFKEALAKAAGRIERFGTYPSELYLKGYEFRTGKDSQHTFYFGYKIKDYSVSIDGDSDSPIEVSVLGNQIVSIKKTLYVSAGEMSILNLDRLYSIDECIINNDVQVSVYFLQDLNVFATNVDTIDYYYPIRSAIDSIEMTYYKYDLGGGPLLIPCWKVVIAGRMYLFDAHSSRLLKAYKLE